MLLWPVHPSLNCQKPGANWPRAGSNVILSAISTRAPRSSWIASLTSQPILTPTDALAQCLEETAQNLRGRGAQAQSQPTHPATVKFYLSKYRDAIRQIDPNHLVLRPRKTRSGPIELTKDSVTSKPIAHSKRLVSFSKTFEVNLSAVGRVHSPAKTSPRKSGISEGPSKSRHISRPRTTRSQNSCILLRIHHYYFRSTHAPCRYML
jgi:hypothetical protein